MSRSKADEIGEVRARRTAQTTEQLRELSQTIAQSSTDRRPGEPLGTAPAVPALELQPALPALTVVPDAVQKTTPVPASVKKPRKPRPATKKRNKSAGVNLRVRETGPGSKRNPRQLKGGRETIQMSVHLEATLFRRMKHCLAYDGFSVSELVASMFEDYLREKGI